MKNKLFYLAFLITETVTYSQQTTLVSSNSTTGLGGSVSYSIGQIAYTTGTGTTETLAQGVQQPYEISTLGVDKYTKITLQFSTYPNPTSNKLNVDFGNYDSSNLSYQLMDISGKILEMNKVTSKQTTIDMENRTTAIYFLKISDKNKEIKIFKIIKK
jgi:hypothetical protein